MKAGQYIIYRNGERYEIGKIKRVTEDGAFVYYSDGDTAAKTPFECMHPLTNEYVIKETSLGGERVVADYAHLKKRILEECGYRNANDPVAHLLYDCLIALEL